MNIRFAQATDLGPVLEISTNQFTSVEEVIPSDEFRKCLWSESPWKMIVGEENGEVLGCVIATVQQREPIPEELSFEASGDITEDVGWLRHGVVRQGHQGEGIGTEMTDFALAYLEGKVSTVYSIAWVRKDGKTSAGLLEAFGFDCVGYESEPWDDAVCAGCDAPTCICDSALYRRSLT